MKKLIILALAFGVLATGTVHFDLVAQTRRQNAPYADQGRPMVNPERSAKETAMIDAAKRTYDGVTALFELGTETQTPIYVWSNYIRASEFRAAHSKEQKIKACVDHLERMKLLHRKVEALHSAGASGFGADKLSAAEFYVAEADLDLLEAKAED